FILCETGGSVGDIEAMSFLEALRQLRNELGVENTLFIHVTYIPYIKSVSELKTKPTQDSVKRLMSVGIYPNFLICRTEFPLDDKIIGKLEMFTNISKTNIIEAIDVKNIYEIPIKYSEQNVGENILKYFDIKPPKLCLKKWTNLLKSIKETNRYINICIVGKYLPCKDAYKSLIEAIQHAGYQSKIKVEIEWIDSREVSERELTVQIKKSDGIIVPGGFGEDGISNKIKAIQISRENNIPFLGICLGMQLAVIEFSKNIVSIKNS
ncbi:unnamed protein product, partial [marine sediment metagenome]